MNPLQLLRHILGSVDCALYIKRSTTPSLGLIPISILLLIMTSCSWTPQVETMIETTAQGSVSLKTVSDETFRASHPITLSSQTISRILTGLEKQKNIRLLQTLVTGEADRKTVLNPDQVKFLTSPLKKAFAQATKEEVIFFHLAKTATNPRELEGTMFVKGNALVVNWDEAKKGRKTKLDRSIKGESGVVGSTSYTPRFSPQIVVIKQTEPLKGYLETIRKDSIFIDYQKLETLSGDSLRAIRTGHDNKATPRTADQPRNKTDASSTPTTNTPSTVQELKRQMEELKKKLAEQEAEIQNLKTK